jgi:hypothetical protein
MVSAHCPLPITHYPMVEGIKKKERKRKKKKEKE